MVQGSRPELIEMSFELCRDKWIIIENRTRWESHNFSNLADLVQTKNSFERKRCAFYLNKRNKRVKTRKILKLEQSREGVISKIVYGLFAKKKQSMKIDGHQSLKYTVFSVKIYGPIMGNIWSADTMMTVYFPQMTAYFPSGSYIFRPGSYIFKNRIFCFHHLHYIWRFDFIDDRPL